MKNVAGCTLILPHLRHGSMAGIVLITCYQVQEYLRVFGSLIDEVKFRAKTAGMAFDLLHVSSQEAPI